MKNCLLRTAFALSLVIPVYGIEENAQFRDNYMQDVMPFMQGFTTGFFQGVDDKQIAYAKFEVPEEKGAIVILPGMCESYVKYGELMYDLRQEGYSFYIMDHRGFGLSERLLADPEKNYVRNFDDYLTDVQSFMEHIVQAQPHSKLILLAHSMGGGIASNYLERHPTLFQGAILCSPMLEVNSGDFPELLAYPAMLALDTIGKGLDYAPGDSNHPNPHPSFPANVLTHSEARWSILAVDLVKLHPELWNSCLVYGNTVHFCRELMEGTFMAQWIGRPCKIQTPILMFQAGQDSFVKPFGQNVFAERVRMAGTECTVLSQPFKEARHEILMEQDPIRNVALDRIKDFLQKH